MGFPYHSEDWPYSGCNNAPLLHCTVLLHCDVLLLCLSCTDCINICLLCIIGCSKLLTTRIVTGASNSKRVFMTKYDLIAQLTQTIQWAAAMFDRRYDDSKRPWAASINVLYRALRPCVIAHPALGGPAWNSPAQIPYELKIEVLWGHAYIAYLETRLSARPASQLGLAEVVSLS